MLSNQFANALVKLKVKKGDRVAVFLPNIPQFVIAYFGVLKAGAVVTAISPSASGARSGVPTGDSGAQTIVALDSLYPIVEKVREKTQLKNVIITGLVENDPSSKCSNALIFEQVLKNSPKTAPKVKVNPLRIWLHSSTRAAQQEPQKAPC